MQGHEESAAELPEGDAEERTPSVPGGGRGVDGADEGGPSGPQGRTPTVPGWSVRRQLGAGADAEVWEVHGPAGERAALKVPLPGGAEGLLQEAAALRHHRHRHLVAPLGEVETDRGTGLLTELLAGGSLAALVRAGGPLTAARMRTAVVPIAQALESLHAEGIVHADVSPSNILFDVDGRPALADLGASRLLGGPTRGGSTPGFAAPESAEGDSGAAGDVFSLAAVAWFCLTGRAPVALQDRAPLPVLVPEADAELGDLLDAALDPDPERRPDAGEFAHALYATGDCEPVLLHASATPEVALVLPTVRPGSPDGAERGGSRRWHRRRGRRGGRDGRAWRDGRGGRGGRGGRAVSDGRGTRDGRRGRGTAERGSPGSAGTVRVRRGVLLGAGGLAAAALATVLLLPGPDDGAPPAAGTAEESPKVEATPDTGDGGGEVTAGLPDAAVLDRIAGARAEALVRADDTGVQDYAVPGSEAEQEDRAVIAALHAQGSRFEDLGISVVPDGEPESGTGPDPAVVAVPVVLETSAHSLVDAAGGVLGEEPARSDPATLVLERSQGRWKVSAVRPR